MSTRFDPDIQYNSEATITDRSSWRPSEQLINRIMAAYRLAIRNYPPGGSPTASLWSTIRSRQTDIHEALLSDKNDTLAEILTNPGSTDLYYGVDCLYRDWCGTILSSLEERAHQASIIADALARLAEALGCRRVRNPENGGKSVPIDVDKTLEALDDRLSTRLTFPNPFAGEFGLMSSRGVMSYRPLHAIYQAWRISQLCQVANGRKCLEIGGGMGRTAYYAQALGIKDYVIVDLPMTLVGQACFLAATCGEQAIWMIGDPWIERFERIRLLPPQLLRKAGRRFSLVLNADSFTEMALPDAMDYILFAAHRSRILLSINHEANGFTVSNLLQQAGLTSDVSRHPYWMRKGYIEETARC